MPIITLLVVGKRRRHSFIGRRWMIAVDEVEASQILNFQHTNFWIFFFFRCWDTLDLFWLFLAFLGMMVIWLEGRISIFWIFLMRFNEVGDNHPRSVVSIEFNDDPSFTGLPRVIIVNLASQSEAHWRCWASRRFSWCFRPRCSWWSFTRHNNKPKQPWR